MTWTAISRTIVPIIVGILVNAYFGIIERFPWIVELLPEGFDAEGAAVALAGAAVGAIFYVLGNLLLPFLQSREGLVWQWLAALLAKFLGGATQPSYEGS